MLIFIRIIINILKRSFFYEVVIVYIYFLDMYGWYMYVFFDDQLFFFGCLFLYMFLNIYSEYSGGVVENGSQRIYQSSQYYSYY